MAAALAAALALGSPQAQADEPGTWSAGLFYGRAVRADLMEILPKGAQNNLDFDPSHGLAAIVRREIGTPDWLAALGRWSGSPVSSSVELTLLKATGSHTNTEVALDWRPSITALKLGPVGVEFALGMGWSHAMGTPYSDYFQPERPDGYKDLFHLTPEVTLHLDSLPGWSLGARVHHRSGIYGVVAPRKVGSNHLGGILMYRF